MKKLYVNINELAELIKRMKSYQFKDEEIISYIINDLKQNKEMDIKEINHGCWKYISTDKKGNMLYECPFCGEQQQGMSQYCGLCGAELEPDWPGRKEGDEQ